jgi:hypothetical protein
MYIQYFWIKDFSGTGWTGSPAGVNGCGLRSSGLGKGEFNDGDERMTGELFLTAAGFGVIQE